MQKGIYSIYDIKARSYSPLMTIDNDDIAIRHVQNGLAQDSNLSKYPQDFRLFSFGTWNEETGNFILEDQPRLVLEIASLIGDTHA